MNSQEVSKRAYELGRTLDQFRRLKISNSNQESKLKRSEQHVLLLIDNLSKKQSVNPSSVSNEMDVTMAAITHHINSLESQGLLVRTIDDNDRRAIKIELSEKGKQVVAKLKRTHKKKLNELIEFLGEEDSELLIKLIQKIFTHVSESKNKKGIR